MKRIMAKAKAWLEQNLWFYLDDWVGYLFLLTMFGNLLSVIGIVQPVRTSFHWWGCWWLAGTVIWLLDLGIRRRRNQ